MRRRGKCCRSRRNIRQTGFLLYRKSFTMICKTSGTMRRRYRRQPDNFAVCGDGRKTDIVNETGKTTGKNNERKKYGKIIIYFRISYRRSSGQSM